MNGIYYLHRLASVDLLRGSHLTESELFYLIHAKDIKKH